MKDLVIVKGRLAIPGIGNWLMKQIDVTVAKSVINLGDDAGKAVVIAIAVEKTDRVENIVEVAGGGDQLDPNNFIVDVMLLQQPVKFLSDSTFVGGQVVSVME